MAKQTINIGTTANDGTGDQLRSAFDKVNDNFTELYSDDAGDVGSIVAGTGISVNQATGDVTVTNSLPNATHTGDVTGSGALTIANDAVTTAKIINDAVTADKLANSINTEIAANTAKVTNATHTGDVTGATALTIASSAVTTAKINNDAVTHDKLEARYTAKATSTGTGSQNIDASTASAFLLTGNVATATLTIQNMKLGQVIDIVLSGTLSSAVITLADDFTTSTINKVGSTSLDQSATNVIQLVCVDDTDSAAILLYSINTYASDTTP